MPQPLPYPFNDPESLAVSPTYRSLRGSPLQKVRLPRGASAWLVIDYDQARFVLSDARFSRAAAGDDVPRQSEAPIDAGLLSMDPPDHTRLRGLLAQAFSMRRVEQLRPDIQRLCTNLVEKLVSEGSPAELVSQYALPVSFGVIAALLGIDETDQAQVRLWSDAHLTTTVLPAEEAALHKDRLRAYIGQLIAGRRAKPGDDLLSSLVLARDQDERLSEAELVHLAINLIFAGFEATSTQIPNFVLFLLERPELWAELCARPDRLQPLIEELLRLVPVMAGAGTMPRYALEDVRIGDTLVAAGEPVLVALGASNRDSRHFPDPDAFDIGRSKNRHLAFGHGPHHCVGMSLARIELQEALAALTRILPGLRLDGDISWKQQVMRGPRIMPVAW